MRPTPEELEYLKEWIPKCKGNLPLFSEKILGIPFHVAQTRLSNEMDREFKPVNLILAGNRSGKSVLVAVKHIYKNFYKECGPGVDLAEADWSYIEYQTLNCAPSSENTKILLKKVLKILRSEYPIFVNGHYIKNNCHIKYFIDAEGLNNYKSEKVPDQGPYEIRFANRSKFRAFTLGMTHGDTIQGDAYGYATYDEFGRSKSPEKEIDDIVNRLIDFNGELDIITTPDMENELAVAYLLDKQEFAMMEDSEWRFLEMSTMDNPYLPKAELTKRLSGSSKAKVEQIVYGRLTLIGANYYDNGAVVKCFEPNRYVKVNPVVNHKYMVGLDTAGSGADYWAVTVVDYTCKPFVIVHTYYDRFAQPEINLGVTKNILDNFRAIAGKDNVTLVMDYSNEAGSIYFRDLMEYMPIKYRFGTQRVTGKSTKAELTDMLRRGINKGLLKSPINNMLKNQLVSYKGPSDDVKQTTDALMSCALAIFYPVKETIEEEVTVMTDVN